MKVIYNNILPAKGYAMNLFGVVLARKGNPVSERTIYHERIHTAQMKEMLYIVFYLWYIVEYLLRLIRYRDHDKAYRAISFEREAYSNDGSTGYLEKRKLFSWVKYLKNNY